ncbi:unnamed protein product [Oncorhynchus mykiss]|uniref:Uncharacterized protein n=1 Tax=Oncorhynchus mykiss TaxID=8022 RepID=A0A060XJQ7_ONCMY|nr:unnamed protein product [Oncorhynchus mykiss]
MDFYIIFSRNYPGNRRLSRRYKVHLVSLCLAQGRKAASGPEDSYSDSALLDSPESDGRRVKSTGDEVGETALPSIQRRPVKEESSIFYAKPVKVRVRNRGHPRPPPRTGPAQASVFRAVQKKREEVQGAEEVLEDENTAVDVPVDQRVAETVEDEDLIGRNPPHYNSQDQVCICMGQSHSLSDMRFCRSRRLFIIHVYPGCMVGSVKLRELLCIVLL